ncbi:MAG: bifunctional oligoribonuclease/PAP phosphatase NrnA [Candidatus Methylacidiphilales bacterium]
MKNVPAGTEDWFAGSKLTCYHLRFFMNDSSLPEALRALASARTIGLISHERPDGDALGSCLGLAHGLRARGQTVHIWNEDGVSRLFRFLPGAEGVTHTPEQPIPVDLVVALDCSTRERLGRKFLQWGRAVDLNVDHHVSNTRYAKVNVVRPDLPSTASLVQEMMETGSIPLGPESASCLFVGVSTDTGSFRYRGTTPETFRAAARLAEAGADVAELARLCYQSLTPERFNLGRAFLGKAEFDCGGRLAVGFLDPAMFTDTGANPEDTEGLVERLLEIGPVVVSALFEIRGPDQLKVSLRSKGAVDVSALAGRFGGGGHPGAAGINWKGDPAEGTKTIRAALCETVNALPAT